MNFIFHLRYFNSIVIICREHSRISFVINLSSLLNCTSLYDKKRMNLALQALPMSGGILGL